MNDLSPFQRQVIVGTLLGDGAMRCKRNPLLEINHCLAQAWYVDWKYNILSDITATPPKARRSNGARVAYRFTTLSSPLLVPFYTMFYRDGRKRIPDIALEPLSLAVWFMDDGNRTRNSVYLNTQQFNEAENEFLAQQLWSQCSVLATLNRDKSYFRLRIAGSSMPQFRRLIGPYLLPEFSYKLP